MNDDSTLFDMIREAPRALTELYVEPPFTVLDRRSGRWQERKRQWYNLGINSGEGRGDQLTFNFKGDYLKVVKSHSGTSVFDPVLCELAYRWWTRPGDTIVDPFAGGSVRGIVAEALDRRYIGIDVSATQLEANRAQVPPEWNVHPRWIHGDARDVRELVDVPADMIFTCPPYADLEVYSDDPNDLSTLHWDEFLPAYRLCIAEAVSVMAEDRFFGIVVGEVRDKKGNFLCFPMETQRAMLDAGLKLYNDAVILDPIGSGAMRASAQFPVGRKLIRNHQVLYLGVKGNPRAAAERVVGSQAESQALADAAAAAREDVA